MCYIFLAVHLVKKKDKKETFFSMHNNFLNNYHFLVINPFGHSFLKNKWLERTMQICLLDNNTVEMKELRKHLECVEYYS